MQTIYKRGNKTPKCYWGTHRADRTMAQFKDAREKEGKERGAVEKYDRLVVFPAITLLSAMCFLKKAQIRDCWM